MLHEESSLNFNVKLLTGLHEFRPQSPWNKLGLRTGLTMRLGWALGVWGLKGLGTGLDNYRVLFNRLVDL